MRTLLATLALTLAASPACAGDGSPGVARSKKAPVEGRFCAKHEKGHTARDSGGTPLVCEPDAKGQLRWNKK